MPSVQVRRHELDGESCWCGQRAAHGVPGGQAHGCTRKHRYPHEVAVVAAARASRRTGESVEPYHCRYCESWHIGHARREGFWQKVLGWLRRGAVFRS